ncbi:MAG: hypothetical protein QUU85_03285, partial [Candidatus Eisenbacteria bacterium]|nr:hypothetical protein [Candidatus Eisenbacteria bacterium]
MVAWNAVDTGGCEAGTSRLGRSSRATARPVRPARSSPVIRDSVASCEPQRRTSGTSTVSYTHLR